MSWSGPPPPEVLAMLHDLQLGLLKTHCVTLAFSSLIFGIFVCQVATYWRLFPRDRILFKVLVGLLTVLEVGYFAVLILNVVDFMVNAFEQVPYTPALQAVNLPQSWILCCIVWICEGYFCFLVYKVVQNWWIRGIAIALALFETGAFLGVSIVYCTVGDFSSYKQFVLLAIGVWSLFAISAFTSVVLTYQVFVKREIRATDDVLTNLLALSQLAGAIGSLLRNSPANARIGVFLSSFYATSAACCVMWNLNHRAVLRQPGGSTAPSGVSGGSQFSGGSKRPALEWRSSATAPAQIQVTTEQTREEDYEDMELDGTGRWRRKGEDDSEV
ncbi:hypothetical protein JCM6882_007070 [Rhodosporidiobolus microsporus]